MAHGPNAPRDAHAWTLGVLLRAGEIGATFPLSATLRGWFTNATSAYSLKIHIAAHEASLAWRADDRDGTAERLAALEQECTASRRDAEAAQRVVAELREELARLEDEVRASRERLPEVGDRVAMADGQSESIDPETPRAEATNVEPETPWYEERAALEAACRQAQERSAELEAALEQRRQDMDASESRERALRAELDAACARLDGAPDRVLADAELERVRTSLAETASALHAARNELVRATEQVGALTQTKDELTVERARLAAELAARAAEFAASADTAQREIEAAEKARGEREARWHEERTALEATCRRAEERNAELEAALARGNDELADAKRRETTLRTELEAAKTPARVDPQESRAQEELGRARASLAEAETALQAMQSELTHATDQLTNLSKARDEAVADRSRLTAELALAEERTADLERRLGEVTNGPVPASRPIPF